MSKILGLDLTKKEEPKCNHLFGYNNKTKKFVEDSTEIGLYVDWFKYCPKCGSKL